MKKILFTLLFSCLALFYLPISSVKADTGDDLVVKFNELQFTVNDYNISNPEVIYSKSGFTEVATVIDSDTGEVVETIELIPDLSRATVSSHTLRRSATFARTTVQLSVNIELYNNGSFRQINSVQGYYLGITNSITNTYIEGQNINVWSPNGYPTTSIKYAYNGTLTAAISSSGSAQVKAELLGAGFTFGGTIGGTSYYRVPFNQNGTISLY
ncbi:hypothetical protein ACVR05_04540 [Streptococcus caprae]|uniref:DUF5626 domain-containing protein n=1 Tax=Streptococcus caprae TaxID=1640501 RepID=A0ABV8CXL3_9STRE